MDEAGIPLPPHPMTSDPPPDRRCVDREPAQPGYAIRPGQARVEGGEADEEREEDRLERPRPPSGREVLGHDAGCGTRPTLPEVKEVKNDLIAGPAIKPYGFFIQWHLTERCNLRCRHCYQGRKKTGEMPPYEVKHEIDGAAEMFQTWE